MLTAKLFSTVTIEWQDFRGQERECEVEVEYTFNGDDLKIIKTNAIGFVDLGYDYDLFDELVWEAVSDQVDEAYAEWLAEREDDFVPAAESYVPAGSAAA